MKDASFNDQVLRLFANACDGRLTPADEGRLAQLLLEDENARQQYVDFCQMYTDLRFHARAQRAGQRAVLGFSSCKTPVASQSLKLAFLGIAVAAAAAVVLLMRTEQWKVQPPTGADDRRPPRHVVTETHPAALHNPTAEADVYVARVVRVSNDVSWAESTAQLDFFLRVRPGDKLNVADGLVQVEFFSGAKLILHGPAVFTAIGPAAGHLQSGRLTGEVSEGDFRLITPAAEVIDLGTAFGVVADDQAGTDVVVFNGKVQVVSRLETAGTEHVLDMTEGMTARIRSDGTAEYGVETEAGLLTRFVPFSNAATDRREVSLVDVLGGGDGMGTCLAGAVDPTTGLKDSRGEPGIRQGSKKYHTVDWHPIIDGVFVPPSRGGQVQVDSRGGTAELPATNNQTWGPLWARRWETALEKADATKDFWGNETLKHILARLKNARTGVVGMHANMGMTIDLRAVQLLHRSATTEFRGTVTNLDNSEERGESGEGYTERIADFLVFIDGQLRYSRLGFGRKDGDADVVVKLRPGDRFLTIVSSDSAGDTSFDHVVLIDPVIVLQQAKEPI